jgi:hypothetical protein
VKDGPDKDLFVMTLGDVRTPLAQGAFDPVKDQVTLQDGSVLPHYYRDTLKLKFYKPMDKSVFPVPPSGLCTWYYYYQDLDEREVKRNADWMAANLQDYGARILQIDDAWQAETAEGRHGSRDWTGVDRHFPGGMAPLAAYIKGKGFVPGLWIAPHGQSNESAVKANPGVFLLKPDGSTASDTWEGKWLVDPSAPPTRTYLKGLFTTLTGWGFDYFKIDGQPIVVEEYGRTQPFMKAPAPADELYRRTLEPIREALGPRRYLLGCWGLPAEGAGIMDGTRTGGDIVLGWSGFMTALEPTMQYYFQHNVAWYTDPDVMLLRAPLTLDQARAWATLQGLTGQAMFSSDRLMDLSRDRVEILHKVFPAADIRPLDLFPSPRNKRVWDLKVSHLGRAYDVVGVFNFKEGKADQLRLGWKDLGLPDQAPVHVYDFWNREYLGAWEAGMAVDVAPTSCRVLTLLPDDGRVQLVSTSRHITQGWVDLAALKTVGTALSGRSRAIRDDPYELTFAFPRGRNYKVEKATARTAAGPLPVQVDCHQGWATVRFTSPRTREVTWNVSFKPSDTYHYPVQAPEGLKVEPSGLDAVSLQWRDQYYLNAGYQVYLDGELLGRTATPRFPLRGLDPRRTYHAEVRTVWEDGTTSAQAPKPKKAEIAFTVASLLADRMPLAALEPTRTEGRTAPPQGFTVGGRHREGLAAHAGSELEFDLKGLYGSFAVQPAFEDSDRDRSKVTFVLLGDGRELWNSGPLGKASPSAPVSIPVAGIQRLVLKALAPGAAPEDDDWLNAPHAAWLDPVAAGLR